MIAERRCNQCWKYQPFPSSFIGRRGKPIGRCLGCQKRYANWSSLSVTERRARVRKPMGSTRLRDHRVSFVVSSGNRKTGPIPVSITDQSSCPPTCSFHDGGCYAAYGHLGSHWRNTPSRGLTWSAFCQAIAALPLGQIWRHNEAGDLPGKGDRLDVLALAQLVRANRGKRGFTFTHKPLSVPAEALAVAIANTSGFTINLSADSLAHADELADLELGPVAVVLVHDASSRASRTPAGRHVIVCPAQTSDLTCEQCRLCANPDRKAIVGFRAHGQSKRIVSELVQLRRSA